MTNRPPRIVRRTSIRRSAHSTSRQARRASRGPGGRGNTTPHRASSSSATASLASVLVAVVVGCGHEAPGSRGTQFAPLAIKAWNLDLGPVDAAIRASDQDEDRLMTLPLGEVAELSPGDALVKHGELREIETPAG